MFHKKAINFSQLLQLSIIGKLLYFQARSYSGIEKLPGGIKRAKDILYDLRMIIVENYQNKHHFFTCLNIPFTLSSLHFYWLNTEGLSLAFKLGFNIFHDELMLKMGARICELYHSTISILLSCC
jgi:hypothetical protein